jgi:serine/threonine-protein kinase HipA
MGRTVNIYMHNILAGVLAERDNEYIFSYVNDYKGKPISLSMPVNIQQHRSPDLHPFFKSLAPEGWLKKRFSEIQKIDERDTLGFLIENGNDLLGAVSMKSMQKVNENG